MKIDTWFLFVKRFITLWVLPLLLQSCSTMYIPAIRAIPLLEKEGEFQMEAGVSTNSVYANISGAITDEIAVSLNGNLSYRNFTNYYDLFTHKDKEGPRGGLWFTPTDLRGMFTHRYGEASVGRINILPTSPMKLEIFGGAGMGKATDFVAYSSDRYGNYKTDYYTFFGQGDYGVKKRKIEAGISVRIAYTSFMYTFDYKYSSAGTHDLYQYKFGTANFEPMGFARVGGEKLKAVIRIGFNLMFRGFYQEINKDKTSSYYLRGFTDSGDLDYTVFHFSVGLSYRIGGNINIIH